MTPLILPIYNRPQFLKLVIEHLRPHRPQDIFVFSDGPVDEDDSKLIGECRALVEEIDWTVPVCTYNEQHYGCAGSIRIAISRTLLDHDRFIVLEDDCVPGPRFLAFAEACLDKYESIPEVGAISCCLPYPLSFWENRPWEDEWDAFFFPLPEPWGWAGWRRTWEMYKKDTELLGVLSTQSFPLYSQRLIRHRIQKQDDHWSPGLYAGLGAANATVVYPTTSHIFNVGARDPDRIEFANAMGDFNLPNIGENCQSAVEAMKSLYGFDRQ